MRVVKPLDVMVLESSPHAADDAVRRLEGAGHRVHRCHEADAAAFPCKAVGDKSACPIAGGVDVALVVHEGAEPAPTAFEEGVGCALRAQVPLVEDGPMNPSPFTPWSVVRVDGDLEQSVRLGAERGLESLRDAIRVTISPGLATVGVDVDDVEIRLVPSGRDMTIDLVGPIDSHLASSLAVRVGDAVRASGRQFQRLGVGVTPAEPLRLGCATGL